MRISLASARLGDFAGRAGADDRQRAGAAGGCCAAAGCTPRPIRHTTSARTCFIRVWGKEQGDGSDVNASSTVDRAIHLTGFADPATQIRHRRSAFSYRPRGGDRGRAGDAATGAATERCIGPDAAKLLTSRRSADFEERRQPVAECVDGLGARRRAERDRHAGVIHHRHHTGDGPEVGVRSQRATAKRQDERRRGVDGGRERARPRGGRGRSCSVRCRPAAGVAAIAVRRHAGALRVGEVVADELRLRLNQPADAAVADRKQPAELVDDFVGVERRWRGRSRGRRRGRRSRTASARSRCARGLPRGRRRLS